MSTVDCITANPTIGSRARRRRGRRAPLMVRLARCGTVLVIEDDAVLRSVIAAFLTEEGFTVEQAGDGRTGLCLAQQLQPDLILLDLPLPMHAGLEVLEQLKDHQPTRAIPILILSAYALILVRQATERADGVLPMPVDLKQLLDRINHLVKDADSRFRLLPPTSVSA